MLFKRAKTKMQGTRHDLEQPVFQPAKVRELRSQLPKLTKAEIRRYRMPFHEAIVIELEEQGLPSTAEFLRQLFDFQEEYRNEHSYDIIIMSRPVLSANKKQIENLITYLSAAELEHYNDNYAGEIDELLKAAYVYSFGNMNWWWLGEQLFAQAISISESYKQDFNFRKTMCYYLYGKYLLEQQKSFESGLQFLNSARLLSEGKKWTARKITNRIEKYVFFEVCTVLYHALVREAKAILKYDPESALKICLEAKARGVDGCIPSAEIFYLQGKCEIEIQQPQKAVGSFLKSYLLYKTSKCVEKCCEAMISLALAYSELGNWAQALEQLQSLLAFAEENSLQYYEAQAYLYMGQYHLNRGTSEFATPHLVKALHIFHEIGDVPHREFVKNLGAVSKGQESFAEYVDLILRCEDHRDSARRRRNLLKLLSWKDMRTPFWDEVSDRLDLETEDYYTLPTTEMADEVFVGEDFSEECFDIDTDSIMGLSGNLD